MRGRKPTGVRKPHVVSCRLDPETYQKFQEAIQGKTKQQVLEALVKAYLIIKKYDYIDKLKSTAKRNPTIRKKTHSV